MVGSIRRGYNGPPMRERATRFPRRVQVRFWPRGDDANAFAGYSRNVSATGMFLATIHPMKPGRVLEIEFQDEAGDFRVRGLVVHSAKISPLLQSVRPSGMGIKFLDRSLELERLLPVEEVRENSETDRTVFPMYFPSPEELVARYDQDVCAGGLFVPTTRPADLEAMVAIEIHLPRPEDPVLVFDARVVHRVDSGEGSGMGIAFENQNEVINRLGPIVESLR